jgi:hypothetical protein
MKEIKVTIKLTVRANNSDMELMDEAVYGALMDQMEDQSLEYKYKVTDDEDEEMEEDEE